MRNAIFYLTYNGIYNFTNGIGTQTQLLLRGLEQLYPTLVRQYGPIDLHIVCPQPDHLTWGYDPAFLRQQQARLTALGGQLHYIPYKTWPEQDLWDVRAWQRLSADAATLLLRECAGYDRCLLICVDQPWLQTPRYMAQWQPEALPQVSSLLVLYNTAFIRNAAAPDREETAWEQAGVDLACSEPTVFLADICPSFTAHLQTFYQLTQAKFAPYTSSILVADEEFTPLDTPTVLATLRHYDVPLDADLVVAFGRAAPIKGFERFIPALAPLRERCHFVLISVPYINDDYQRTYDDLLATHRLRATHVRTFTRELPKALCQWARTRLVVMPSQQETFSNIPLEVALWAQAQGPVVATSRVGGFLDQIVPGKTGFFLDTDSHSAMTQTVQHVLDLPAETHLAIRRQAYEQVSLGHDFLRNFPATLRWFWGTPQA